MNLASVERLLTAQKIYAIKAIVNLENPKEALILEVPGFSKPNVFTLAQSGEAIISILCKEIPYVISDLLCIIIKRVFYKGFLIMQINNELCLLQPTCHSLETDFKSLARGLSQRKRLQLERLFYIQVGGRVNKPRKGSIWCPAKEVYRSYLRKLIDRKLCPELSYHSANFLKEHLDTIQEISAGRLSNKEELARIMVLLPISRKGPNSTQQCYFTSVSDKCSSPKTIIAKKDQISKTTGSGQTLLESGQSWMEILCDNPQRGIFDDVEHDGNLSNSSPKRNGICNTTTDTHKVRHSRFSVRIFQDCAGHFWARPIISEAKIRELQADNPIQLPQACFLGNGPEDCRKYLSRLFVSVAERGSMLLEITQPINGSLSGALPKNVEDIIYAYSNGSTLWNPEIEMELFFGEISLDDDVKDVAPFSLTPLSLFSPYQYSSLVFTGSFLVYLSAKWIVRNSVIIYVVSALIGVFLSFIVFAFALQNLIPRGFAAIPIRLGGWPLSLYVYYKVYQNIGAIFRSYPGICSTISTAICYRWGPPSDPRTLNLMKWSLQLLSCVAIYTSIEHKPLAVTIITLLVTWQFWIQAYKLIRSTFLTTKKMIRKYLYGPEPRKLLSEEEYQEEKTIYTNLELDQLRNYCRNSPPTKNWKLVSRLHNPQRMASFINGDSDHVNPTEVSQHSHISYTDDEDSDGYLTDDD
ncbi:NEMP family domain-containing protein [Ditylenchus destructor]|nr:NEMP family domain-containing protein [Ditylenchus destructor]